ncbi:MAG: hypothetical protein GY758_00980 [Fuerstiella sp.]|nr:hypothetical protein [Fuerstiella sp.]
MENLMHLNVDTLLHILASFTRASNWIGINAINAELAARGIGMVTA